MVLNTREIIKKLQNNEKVTVDYPSSDPEIQAHITIKPTKAGEAILTGYPIRASPKEKLDTKTTQRTAKSIHSIELSLRDLAAAIVSKYKKGLNPTAKRPKKAKRDNTITKKLSKIKGELLCPENYVKYTSKIWAASTTEAAVNYLICSIAPAMDQRGDDICEEDMRDIKEHLIARAATSARGKLKKDGTRSPKSADTVESGLEERYRRAGIVYQWVLENHPELELPDVEFIKSPKEKKSTSEKAKALPDDIRVRLANLIVMLCSMGVSLAFGVALEFFCGLRVSEAAAPLISELILITDDTTCLYGKYFVKYQLDSHGKRTHYLKRNASKRYVPLTSAMVRIVQMRIEQLKTSGFSDEQIPKMPFVAYRDTPNQFVSQQKLADFAKNLLVMAGCNAEYIEKATKLMYRNPERDESGSLIPDVTSHLCRRDYATRMKGHFSALELDAILGHENSDNKCEDYASNDTMRRLAREAEVSFVFDENLTQNPAFRPIQLIDNADIHLIGNTAYSFENNTDHNIMIDFDLLNLEPNDSLFIQAKSGAQIKRLQRRTPSDTPSNRMGRRIRNRQVDSELIKKWKDEAAKTDLSPLLKKYDH